MPVWLLAFRLKLTLEKLTKSIMAGYLESIAMRRALALKNFRGT